ncbi:hypothetical protein CDD83_10948 [Cordyceps sp. RAO-2017]|nr:hypothetical protein CDD83_10948 [Cordyceps sp. RAO-2017]
MEWRLKPSNSLPAAARDGQAIRNGIKGSCGPEPVPGTSLSLPGRQGPPPSRARCRSVRHGRKPPVAVQAIADLDPHATARPWSRAECPLLVVGVKQVVRPVLRIRRRRGGGGGEGRGSDGRVWPGPGLFPSRPRRRPLDRPLRQTTPSTGHASGFDCAVSLAVGRSVGEDPARSRHAGRDEHPVTAQPLPGTQAAGRGRAEEVGCLPGIGFLETTSCRSHRTVRPPALTATGSPGRLTPSRATRRLSCGAAPLAPRGHPAESLRRSCSLPPVPRLGRARDLISACSAPVVKCPRPRARGLVLLANSEPPGAPLPLPWLSSAFPTHVSPPRDAADRADSSSVLPLPPSSRPRRFALSPRPSFDSLPAEAGEV